VNDQKKKHGKSITIATVKVGEGQSKEEIKKAKLTTHGIVAKDKNGKLVTAVEGHNYGRAKVEEVINRLLRKK